MDFLPTPDRSQNNTVIALVDEGLSVSLNDTAAKVGFAVLIPRHQIACWSRRALLYSRRVSKCSRQEDHHSHCGQECWRGKKGMWVGERKEGSGRVKQDYSRPLMLFSQSTETVARGVARGAKHELGEKMGTK